MRTKCCARESLGVGARRVRDYADVAIPATDAGCRRYGAGRRWTRYVMENPGFRGRFVARSTPSLRIVRPPNQEIRVFRKFVLITGGLDIPIGLATMAAALFEPHDAHFGALMTCGAFLMFAGAALLWSAADLNVRAPIVFWQGLVRLTAVGSILYMVPAGLAESWQYGVVAFDGVIALVYIVGSLQHTGQGFFGLLAGKAAA